MAVYTFLLVDMVSGQVTGAVPLLDVFLSRDLLGNDSLTGSLALADPSVQASGPHSLTSESRTAVYVDRDGRLLFGGPIWKRLWDSNTKLLQIQAEGWMSYLNRRIILQDSTYTNVDELTIAAALVTQMQVGVNDNVHIIVPNLLSGEPRTITYLATDRKSYGQALVELATLLDGFDVGFEATYVGGVPTPNLILGYPRRGASYLTGTVGAAVLEYPGNVSSYRWPIDGTLLATQVIVDGQGSGGANPSAIQQNAGLLQSGYPGLDRAFSYSDLTDQAQVTSHVQAQAAAWAQPTAFPEVRVRAELDPILGSYTVGDDIRLILTDPWFPALQNGAAGLDMALRIIKLDIQVQTRDQPEMVIVTLGPVPVF
jgi:hypothetical protein